MTTRRVHFQLEQAAYERARHAAALDRRSLANWLALIVERAAADLPERPAEDDPARSVGGRP